MKDLSKATTAELLAKYRKAAVAHGEGTDSGSFKRASRNAEALAVIRDELKGRGDLSALLPLLDDATEWVRCWAACDLWPIEPAKALAIMSRLADESKGIVGFNAKKFIEHTGVMQSGIKH